jgi:hypothetical protein
LHKQAALKVAAPDFEPVYAVNESGALAQSPWIAILNKQALILASLGDRLGLDPKARAMLKLPYTHRKSRTTWRALRALGQSQWRQRKKWPPSDDGLNLAARAGVSAGAVLFRPLALR